MNSWRISPRSHPGDEVLDAALDRLGGVPIGQRRPGPDEGPCRTPREGRTTRRRKRREQEASVRSRRFAWQDSMALTCPSQSRRRAAAAALTCPRALIYEYIFIYSGNDRKEVRLERARGHGPPDLPWERRMERRIGPPGRPKDVHSLRSKGGPRGPARAREEARPRTRSPARDRPSTAPGPRSCPTSIASTALHRADVALAISPAGPASATHGTSRRAIWTRRPSIASWAGSGASRTSRRSCSAASASRPPSPDPRHVRAVKSLGLRAEMTTNATLPRRRPRRRALPRAPRHRSGSRSTERPRKASGRSVPGSAWRGS